MTPSSFTQHHADGFSTSHAWGARSSDIIRRNLERTDLPEPITRVTVHMTDGSHVVVRRRTR